MVVKTLILFFGPFLLPFWFLNLSGGHLLMAQSGSFKHYSVREGVSQSEIKCIFQDSEGFLWIGTQNGLNKFDGYGFERFFHDPEDPASLSNNWIFSITEDSSGLLWIGTKGGVNRFDKKTGRFSVVQHLPAGASVHDNFIYGVAADDSCLYVNVPPILSVINLNTGKLGSYENDFTYDGALYDFAHPILVGKDGMIWIGSRNGLSRFDPRNKSYRNFRHDDRDPGSISNNQVTALSEDKQGHLLVGTIDGLNILDRRTGSFHRYVQVNGDSLSISNNFVRSLTADHEGNIWVGTEEGGLNRLKLEAGGNITSCVHFRNMPGNSGSISHDIVYSLLLDHSGNLWIGTLAGLDKIDLKRKKFRHYKSSNDPESVDLLDNVIASIYKDETGKLWVGNWNKGLNIIDPTTGKVAHYSSYLAGRSKLPGNHVHVIFKDRQSRIWIGTRNGVSLYDRNTGFFVPFQDVFSLDAVDYFRDNRVYCMLEDFKGRIWIGTGRGIFLLESDRRSYTLLHSGENDPLNLSNNLVYSLYEDSDHDIWIATSNGLDQYISAENRIRHYIRDPLKKNTLCDNFTISVCQDINGSIWIGTASGINKYSKKDAVFTYYSMKDGLPSNIIYDILEDNNHDLWFTTGNGLAHLSIESGAFEPFTLEEGFQGMEFNIKAIYKGDDGELFFGGMDGFISFYPDSLVGNDFIPPVRITSFEKENDGIRSRMNVSRQPIYLTYRDYSFTIEFSALDFSDPLKNQYAYQMEPLSDKWIPIGNRRFVHFTNLPPGKYVFRVKGSNNDGIWNDLGTEISITLSPPWWKSSWAYGLYLLVFILMVIIYIRSRERLLKSEKKQLEVKVQERTEEIQRQKDKLDELNSTKDKFFSILAHDLKSPFSSLYSMSDLLSGSYDTLEDTDRKTGLMKVRNLAEQIFRLLENLLTWSKSQRGGMDFTPVPFNLARLVEVNINLHKPAAQEKGVVLSNKAEGEFMAFGDLDMINTVVRNLISNAVKFTGPQRSVIVEILEDTDFYEVQVMDEGVGISPENMQKLFRIDVKYKTTGTAGETGTGLGLVICREFVERNGGRIWCESREHSGTVFHFSVPRRQERKKESGL
jgi:ligand-binding sensor domain-containing protein/signal transduction histidine kinase